MAPAFTTRQRLLKQETYSNPETWGEELNAGMIDMIDEAFGIASIVVDADVTLTTQNAISDQARRMALLLSGAGGFNVVAPALGKLYLVINNCAANVTLKTSVTAGVAIRAGTAAWAYFDGTNWQKVDPTLDRIAAPTADVSLNGQKLINVAPATVNTDAATLGQLKPFADAAAESADEAAETLVLVEGLYTLFGELFLGAHASDPATDNEGNPLVVGTLYFNTTVNELRVFNGFTWQGGVTDIANLVVKLNTSVITTTTAGQAGFAYYVDTSGGAFTLTLPASAGEGVRVGVSCGDSVTSNALTIDPNGQTFDGATTSFEIATPCTIVFRKTSSEWRLEP